MTPENNPEVLSKLAHHLGLSTSLSFTDIYSIDEPDLPAAIPRPCYGLLLVFPVSESREALDLDEDAGMQEYDGCGEEEEVIWFKQTIATACGMIGLLHCLMNGKARPFITPDSELDRLLEEITPLKPIPRANALCDIAALEVANEIAAAEGESEIIPANVRVDLHFVCFTKSETGGLWELDGIRKGPINRGLLRPQEDVLSPRALDLGVRDFLRRERDFGVDDSRFSLVGLVSS